MSYLRHRPFMIITYSSAPVEGAHTHIAGWHKTHGWDVTERMVIDTKVSSRMLKEAHVILDLIAGKVVKNREQDTIDLFTHFVTKYDTDVKMAIDEWRRLSPVNEALYIASTQSEKEEIANAE